MKSEERSQKAMPTSTLYAKGTWTVGPKVPPIFDSSSNRKTEGYSEIDQALRDIASVGSLSDYEDYLGRTITRFDVGNFVNALSTASKLVSDRRGMASFEAMPAFHSLLRGLEAGVAALQPRGIAMVCYALGKLERTYEPLLPRLVERCIERARDLNCTDAARVCWGFAKLDVTESQLWSALLRRLPGVLADTRAVDLSMITWSLGSLELGDEALYQLLADVTLAQLDDIPPQGLSNALWAFAKRRQPHPRT
eukprot:TRINITY_DN12465_c0_g1_i1.p1 TRINITY_DN12465_c0_g1~~TRINITY_DN12465_c0_g1_i1.p1  ORF type:complete len:252 (-),score=45.04 TRINITY_DN12465_c0_g1_i1:268-1023(-)